SAAFTSDTINYLNSTGALVGGQNIIAAATTTALASSANPSTFFAPITLTATVAANTPATAVPVGSVTFYDGLTPISPAIALAGGVATFNIASLAVSPPSHSLRAVYSPSSDFLTSTGNLTQVVNKGITSTSIASTLNPAIISVPTITATVNVPAG